MSTTSVQRVEIHERSWEAIDSLLRTLGSSLDLSEVVQRGLLTVSGQLLMRRVALYLVDEEGHFDLEGCLGIRKERLGESRIQLQDHILQDLRVRPDFQNIVSANMLPNRVREHFELATLISDGEEVLGLLLLGGSLGAAEFGSLDLRVLRTLGIVLGTTIQRILAYEKVLEAKDRMERVQQLQQQIIDHVSHEFNTPLLILKSSIEFYRNADEEQRNELRAMHDQSVERLETLISNILEVGDTAPNPSTLIPMGHSDLVELCIMPALDASPWPQNRARIENRIDESAMMLIEVQILQRALCALLDNAWRFAGESGSGLGVVTYLMEGRRRREEDLQPRLESLSAALDDATDNNEPDILLAGIEEVQEPDTFVIEIVDAGIGIPEPEWSTVFEPFAQASNSPTRYVSGTGMGLALARRRVEAMRGEIALTSRENLGSLFVILLPVIATAPRPDSSAKPRS